MDFFDAVKTRYSYRDEFQDATVLRDDLIRIVQAGLDAPSGKNQQTTRFIIVDEPEKLNELRPLMPAHKTIQTCKAMIICLTDKDPELIYHGNSFQVEDCSAAVENMLLSITALGYASVWLDGVLRVDSLAEQFGALLHVPDSKQIRVILPVGIPKGQGPRKEKLVFNDRVNFQKYSEKPA